MNTFDLPELPSFFGLGAVVVGLAIAGYVAYNKLCKKVSLKINNIGIDKFKITFSIIATNLRSKKTSIVYHLEYKDFSSETFTLTLEPNEVKFFNLAIEAAPQDPSTVDKSLAKLVVDEVTDI